MVDSKVFEGRAPGGAGGMVELRDGRWLRVWSGLNVSYSNDRGRTWSASEPLQNRRRTHYRYRRPDLPSAFTVRKAGSPLRAS